MPAAARADRKYLWGTLSSRIDASVEGDDEHAPPTLGHSEVLSVENPVGPPVPEFPQSTEERPKVLASMTGEKSRNVLEEDGGRSVSLHKGEEGERQSGSGTGEPSPLPGNREVLAGEASRPEGGVLPVRIGDFARIPARSYWCQSFIDPSASKLITIGTVSPGPPSSIFCGPTRSEGDDVSEVRNAGPVLCEDARGIGVDLGEGDGSPSGSLQSQVKASHSAEERGVREFHVTTPSPRGRRTGTLPSGRAARP
jgi:hypothetical protein